MRKPNLYEQSNREELLALISLIAKNDHMIISKHSHLNPFSAPLLDVQDMIHSNNAATKTSLFSIALTTQLHSILTIIKRAYLSTIYSEKKTTRKTVNDQV